LTRPQVRQEVGDTPGTSEDELWDIVGPAGEGNSKFESTLSPLARLRADAGTPGTFFEQSQHDAAAVQGLEVSEQPDSPMVASLRRRFSPGGGQVPIMRLEASRLRRTQSLRKTGGEAPPEDETITTSPKLRGTLTTSLDLELSPAPGEAADEGAGVVSPIHGGSVNLTPEDDQGGAEQGSPSASAAVEPAMAAPGPIHAESRRLGPRGELDSSPTSGGSAGAPVKLPPGEALAQRKRTSDLFVSLTDDEDDGETENHLQDSVGGGAVVMSPMHGGAVRLIPEEDGRDTSRAAVADAAQGPLRGEGRDGGLHQQAGSGLTKGPTAYIVPIKLPPGEALSQRKRTSDLFVSLVDDEDEDKGQRLPQPTSSHSLRPGASVPGPEQTTEGGGRDQMAPTVLNQGDLPKGVNIPPADGRDPTILEGRAPTTGVSPAPARVQEPRRRRSTICISLVDEDPPTAVTSWQRTLMGPMEGRVAVVPDEFRARQGGAMLQILLQALVSPAAGPRVTYTSVHGLMGMAVLALVAGRAAQREGRGEAPPPRPASPFGSGRRVFE
jgi:hypothetical protein